MPVAAIGVNSRALWYLTRGTGLVALVLLTVTLVLGVTQVVRYASPGLPRFVISALHKNASLVAMLLLAVHIVTAVLDTFAPIRVVDVFVPFVGAYRPVWLGLGALAFDLMLVLVVTSLIRERIGLRVWRVIHWAAYASWPIALAHGLGTGSDSKVSWVLALNALCLAAVVGAVAWRLVTDWTPATAARRTGAAVGAVATVLAVGIWTVAGPMRAGWSRTAGTPKALLRGGAGPSSLVAQSATAPANSATALSPPFTATFSGSLQQGSPDSNGVVQVTISGQLTGSVAGAMTVVLDGTPAAGGGISLSRGQVSIGPTAAPTTYSGPVDGLSDQVISASVSSASGQRIRLTLQLTIDQASGSANGTVQAAT